MSNTLWTLLVAAVTAMVTALAVGLFISPRMEARKKRVGDLNSLRDTFHANLMRITTSCQLLKKFELPAADDPHCTPAMRERLTGERNRWWQQIDEATMWLVDNAAIYASSWPFPRLVRLANAHAYYARVVVMSERDEAMKVEFLRLLTVPVFRQFFGFPWARARHVETDQRAFDALCMAINAEPNTP
ncbi:hypothetical protein HY68_35740 [Streptomyces sp. AcH 505]|uniref:hypothetical protein n=1 Tax=Streptomyces sp. AcH 505 TaxID=352211 RepID=UPI0005923F41|nr:hypothetical protein HY68_35740 [Streptomyces sp. AcH 505]